MKLLYKAYGCARIDGKNLLLPGYPVDATTKPVPAGSKIQVELADGTLLQTLAVDTQIYSPDETVTDHLRVKKSASSPWYCAIQVPDDFSPAAVELGVKVFLVE